MKTLIPKWLSVLFVSASLMLLPFGCVVEDDDAGDAVEEIGEEIEDVVD